MRRWTIGLAFVVTLAGGTLPATKSLAGPATQPAADPAVLQPLIAQLGDPSFARREDAAAAIRKLGPAALPALRDAAKGRNLQVASGAERLLDDLDPDGRPKPPEAPVAIINGWPRLNVQAGNLNIRGANIQMQVMVQAGNLNAPAIREVTASANGQQVHIREDGTGIQMQVTANGQTKEYKAKTADELKEKEPEAFKVYEQYSAKGGRVRIGAFPGR